MTAHTEHTGHRPVVDNGGVVCCGECGAPLELRCANGHDPLPIDVRAEFTIEVERQAAPETVAAPAPVTRERRAPASAPVYAPKVCKTCLATFTPSGPRSLYCPTCRGVA